MDESVIICEEVLPDVRNERIDAKWNDEKFKVMCRKIGNYESPLKHMKPNRTSPLMMPPCVITSDNEQNRQHEKETNFTCASDKHDGKSTISGDSIIILSDSEIESSSVNANVNTRKRKRESISVENEFCCQPLSDSEDTGIQKKRSRKSLKPNQDDITVLWSSVSQTQDVPLFVIDNKPSRNIGNVLGDSHSNVVNFCQPKKGKKRMKGKQAGREHRVQKLTSYKKKLKKLPHEKRQPKAKDRNIEPPSGQLREIVIDGCNVATTCDKVFSEDRIMLVTDYFKKRGHSVKVFVPQHKRSHTRPLLEKLFTEGIVVFTPSRQIGGRIITPYDDRYILEYATLCDGIVVSSDQFRDLYEEKPEWRDTIINRLLQPTFVGNCVLFPEDPLGRRGPTLDQFLRHPS